MEPTGSHSYEGSTWSWKPQKKEAAKPVCHPWIPMAVCADDCYQTKLVANVFPLWVEKCGLGEMWPLG